MTDVPDDDDSVADMVETLWDGQGTWFNRVIEVAISPKPDGDVILTLPPQAISGTTSDGSKDVAIPLALIRWLADNAVQGGGQTEGSSS